MSLSDSIEENPPPFVSPLLTSTPSGTPMWSDNERQEVEDPEEKIRNARQKVKDLKKKIRNAIKIRKVEEVTLFWKRRCEEAEVRLAKLREELKKATEEEYEARQQLREEHMKRFVVPTVTKILRQAVYEKEAGIAGSVECICGRGDEPERIRAQKHKFIEIGFENDEDVDAFAECVSFCFLHSLTDMQHNELKLTLSISGLVSWKDTALLSAG